MSAVLTKRGAPLPYHLEARGDPLVQHAIIVCIECGTEDSFIWRDPQNPTAIVQRFIRKGWEIYKSSRSRCPECKHKRKQQRAAFARRDEMQSTPVRPQISLVKAAQPEKPAPAQQTHFLLVIDEAGVPSIKPLEGVQEMLLGDRAYLVIPQTE